MHFGRFSIPIWICLMKVFCFFPLISTRKSFGSLKTTSFIATLQLNNLEDEQRIEQLQIVLNQFTAKWINLKTFSLDYYLSWTFKRFVHIIMFQFVLSQTKRPQVECHILVELYDTYAFNNNKITKQIVKTIFKRRDGDDNNYRRRR